MRTPLMLLAGACLAGAVCAATPVPGGPDTDIGKPGPALVGAAWDGNPVSLGAVKGNAVLLAFWDSKASC
jgi:hypothetical protein